MRDIGVFYLNRFGNWDLAVRELMYITRIVINDIVTIYSARPIDFVRDLEKHLGKRVKVVESQSILDLVNPNDS